MRSKNFSWRYSLAATVLLLSPFDLLASLGMDMYLPAVPFKVSGTRADRPGLGKTLEMLREGDTLVVWKLDRLGRSVKQLVDLVGDPA